MLRIGKSACLMYHQITDDDSYGKFRVGVKDFLSQLEVIKDIGLQSIDLLRHEPFLLTNGVLITLDDGHESNLFAAHALAERGLKAVFYILKKKSLSEPGFLRTADIAEISHLGHSVGVHGVDHKWWTTKSDAQLITELKDCKSWLEDITGSSVITCSAPGGRLTSRVVENIRMNIPEFRYIRSSVESYNCGDVLRKVLNSVPICKNTTLSEYTKLITLDRWTYARRLTVYRVKEAIKGVLHR